MVSDRLCAPLPHAPGVAAIKPSGIREVMNMAAEIPGVIRLDVGQPDFATPVHIRQAAKDAIDRGETQYTNTQGTPALREAICEKLKRVNGLSVTSDQISCANGGVGAIAAAMAATLSCGDEVLVPDPGWPNYRMVCAWLQAKPIGYPCRAKNDFEPDLEDLKRLISPRTRMLIVNSPNNPTGAVYSPDTLRKTVSFARNQRLWLLSDECYDQINFADDRPGLSTLAADYRGLISVFSCSKTYAMTGWRLGYAVAENGMIADIAKVLESNSSCPCSISQAAALAAFTGPSEVIHDMVRAYRERRDLVASALASRGLLLHRPDGAFYCMADISSTGMPSRDFAFALLRERGVSVAPGSAFGDTTDSAVRISLAASSASLSEGTNRLIDFVRGLARDGGKSDG